MRDPSRAIARARGEVGPVFYAPALRSYIVTDYDDVKRVLTDFETFSSAANLRGRERVPPEFADRVPASGLMSDLMIVTDPPRHTSTRKLANRGFRRPRMAALEEPITDSAHDLIDALADRRDCDLMIDYAFALTYRSLVMLLDLPREDIPMLTQLAFDVIALLRDPVSPLPPDALVATWGRWLDAREYLAARVYERVEAPGDDVISLYATELGTDAAPTIEKVVTDLSGVIAAGADTTANTIGHGALLLTEHPEQLAHLRTDPTLWPNATEEVMRLHGSLPAPFRTTTEEVEIRGYPIPAASTILAYGAGAAFDPSHFPDPERFDVARENADQHLAFGKGRHLCLGAPLGRLQARIGLQVVFERLPDLEVVPGQSMTYLPSVGVPSLTGLAVRWTAPAGRDPKPKGGQSLQAHESTSDAPTR